MAREGEPPIGLERMLNTYYSQKRYGLADAGAKEALCGNIAMRAFAKIEGSI